MCIIREITRKAGDATRKSEKAFRRRGRQRKIGIVRELRQADRNIWG